MSDTNDVRGHAFTELAAAILAGATQHNVPVADFFYAVMDELARNTAALLGIELCDCSDHTRP